MDELGSVLEREYCPPIDSSLFRALLSDYDLTRETELKGFRDVLDALKQSAQDESATQFDPSGTSGFDDDGDSQQASEQCHSCPVDSMQSSCGTECTTLTGLSATLEGVRLDEQIDGSLPHLGPNGSWATLSSVQKNTILQEIFPGVRGSDIAFILKKNGDDYGRAVEELLNQVFLEAEVDESGVKTLKRGIDGFSEPLTRNRRMKKGKTHAQRRTSSTPAPFEGSSENSTSSALNRWDRGKEDIDFIATRTRIPSSAISSLYHKQGASLSATLVALCSSIDSEGSEIFDAPATMLQLQADELVVDFPRLGISHAKALVAMTYPSTAAAHEFARALLSFGGTVSDAQIIPRYRPRSPSPATASNPSSPNTLSFPTHTTDRLVADHAQASSQASSAYRISRSKPLMSGAAAYYSSVARDATSAIREREAAEAEALVKKQSRAGQIDLHGITVQDAVRIARQRAEQWWENEGREWAREGKARNRRLVFVTGKGQHSQGGKGRLGPAVGSMLFREGWKVEVGEGVIDVVGRARK